MSILIHGMELPTKCSECNFCVNGFTDEAPVWECACEATEFSSSLVNDKGKPFDFKPDWCPLVEVKEPHWIPVTERLPKEDGNYLVSGKWGSGKESVGDCEFSVEDGYFQTAWNFDVLAWLPLPEPFVPSNAK